MAGEALLKILRREGLVSPVQISEVHERMQRDDHLLSLLARHGVDPRAMAEALSRNLSVPLVELVQPSRNDIAVIERHFGGEPVLWTRRMLPLAGGSDDTIVLGMADPTEMDFVQDLRFALGQRIEARVVSVRDVETHLAPPSGVSGIINRFDPLRATLVEMTTYALVRSVKSDHPLSVVAGVRHPDDYPPPFDMSRLQNQTVHGIIRRLRLMTGSTDEDEAGVALRVDDGRVALIRVGFTRHDQCATVSFDGYE